MKRHVLRAAPFWAAEVGALGVPDSRARATQLADDGRAGQAGGQSPRVIADTPNRHAWWPDSLGCWPHPSRRRWVIAAVGPDVAPQLEPRDALDDSGCACSGCPGANPGTDCWRLLAAADRGSGPLTQSRRGAQSHLPVELVSVQRLRSTPPCRRRRRIRGRGCCAGR